jgi:prepilin-type processing-associated H-X9-DG protein
MQCANNLKQMGLALHNYHDVMGTFPPAHDNRERPEATLPPPASRPSDRIPGWYPYWSWMARLMPFYEQDNLYRAADAWARSGPLEEFRYWPWGGFWLSPPTPPNPALGTLVKVWTCPADQRTLQTSDVDGLKIAFTAYLGVSGIRGDCAGERSGIITVNRTVRIGDITDGTSNTAMVGERPPSSDLVYGWWFAGAGYDDCPQSIGRGASGSGDVVLGAREVGLAAAYGCPATRVGLQPGRVTDPCTISHFWSQHAGGANFVMGDGSVRFVSYAADRVLPQMFSRNLGEVYSEN